jgi:2-polyprenyl-3-methyl-5-hydroxy-6-metoxy-1,4-benzoquinol methylase
VAYEFAVEVLTECPLCGGHELVHVITNYDDRHGQPDEFEAVECRSCGLAFLRQMIVPAQLAALYAKYYSNLRSPDAIQANEARVLRKGPLAPGRPLRRLLFFPSDMDLVLRVRPGERVLEVGCGRAIGAQRFADRGAQWTGLEIDRTHCEWVRQRGWECYHGIVEELAPTIEARYDAVIGSQVLEHVASPRPFVRACASLLRPGGRLIFAIPHYDAPNRSRCKENWLNWHMPYHRFHYNKRSLNRLAESEGLRVTRFQTKTPFHWIMIQRQWVRPPRGQANPDWRGRYRMANRITAMARGWYDIFRGAGEACVVEMQPNPG